MWSARSPLACLLVLMGCLPRIDIVEIGSDGGGGSGAMGSPTAGSGGDGSGASGASGASVGVSGAGGDGAGGDGGASGGTGGAGGTSDGGAAGTAGSAGKGGATGTSGAAGSGGTAGGSGAGGKGGSGGNAGTAGATGSGGKAGSSGAGGGGATGGGGKAGSSGAGGGCGTVPSSWANWPMPNSASSGLPNRASYTTTPDVVHDNVTGLDWQRNADSDGLSWNLAMSYCAMRDLGGCRGWRLPTKVELVSILDYGRRAPAIDVVAFPGTFVEPYWTSTPSPLPPSNPGFPEARYVDFTDGRVTRLDRNGRLRVRCVR